MTSRGSRIRRSLALAGAAFACALCALPVAAGAQGFDFESSFGSGLQADERFVNAAGVATDEAGRVYVADTGRGIVEVFDNASDNNRFLGVVGSETLVAPVGVVVDNRQRIWVADAARNVVTIFDAFTRGAIRRTDFGGMGTGLGQMINPRYLSVDKTGQVWVSERETVRVQSFKPTAGRENPRGAFGVSEPEIFNDPEGLARDGDGRIFLSDASPTDGQVRAYSRGGRYLREVASPGSAPGQVSAPQGIARDSAGRFLVADSGNNRIQVFAPFASENAFLSAVGSLGSGRGQFRGPSSVAVAPGARVYVADTGNGRIVRFRFDDTDEDGALDARDNCQGLANPDQRDTDRDQRGNACDDDDDGDGVADDADRCPQQRAGRGGTSDGCPRASRRR